MYVVALLPSTSAAPAASVPVTPNSQRECPTFDVVSPDRATGYRAGEYDMGVSGPVSCHDAVRLFTAYLHHPGAGLPGGWTQRRHYAGFTDGVPAFNVFQPPRATTHYSYGSGRLCVPDAGVFASTHAFPPGHYALLVWGETSLRESPRCLRALHARRADGSVHAGPQTTPCSPTTTRALRSSTAPSR